MSLAEKTCLPCRGGVPPLTQEQYQPMLDQLSGWKVESGKKLTKTIAVDNFQKALDLANTIGHVAEEQGHHPDLLVRWGSLGIELWTHAIDGLTESDFILAAKIDQIEA